jgi:hypothetical protein
MRNWGIDWRQVPSSLWAFEGVLAAGITLAFASASVPVRPVVFGVCFVLLWCYLLLRGYRSSCSLLLSFVWRWEEHSLGGSLGPRP